MRKWFTILWMLVVGCNRVGEETAVPLIKNNSPLPAATPAHANAVSQECLNLIPADRRFPLTPWPSTNFCRHSVPYDALRYGGLGRDVIPALDNPTFDRTVAGQTLDFGVSGILRNADLIMYDRQTESWWQQFTGEAIVGEMTGQKLSLLPVSLVSWVDFKTQFPNGRVLSIFTGYDRRYGENPYINYDSLTNLGVKFYDGQPDDRLLPKMRVMAIVIDEKAIAYPYELLSKEMVINDQFAEQPLVVFWKSGTNSPLGLPVFNFGFW